MHSEYIRSFDLYGELKKNKRRQFYIEKYALQRTHDVVGDALYLQFLITR